MSYFSAISTEISSNMWLTYFYSDSTGALDIKGNTNEVGSLYSFFRGIKGSVPQSSITLTKLEYNDIDSLLSPDSQGNKTMNFEIANSSYNNVVNMMASQVPADEEGENKNSSASPSKRTKKPGDSGVNSRRSGNDFESNDDLPDLPTIEPPTN